MLLFYSVVRIVLIDLVLSGDNAVVIGMAAHRLPLQQRRMAILFGGIVAMILRVVLLSRKSLGEAAHHVAVALKQRAQGRCQARVRVSKDLVQVRQKVQGLLQERPVAGQGKELFRPLLPA